MKTTTKTIICGLTALALYACSSDNTTSPETADTGKTAIEKGGEDGIRQIRLEPSEQEAYIDGILEGEVLSNMIIVDPPICGIYDPEEPEDCWCCQPYRVQLESGKIYHHWDGLNEKIFCETEQDTIWYSVTLHNNTITKKWQNPYFSAEISNKTAFRDSCIAEGGNFTEENDSLLVCELTLEPVNTDKEYTPPPEDVLSLEFSFHYDDPNWTQFATGTIANCRITPVF